MIRGEINPYKERLLALRARLRSDVSQMANTALERTPAEANGDLSIMPIHMADVAGDYYEREFALSLVESGDQTLRQIEEALERMEAGVYAVCKDCEAKIPKVRLDAVPYTTLCVKCASQNECEQRSVGRPIAAT